jgi:2-haloacid dehalogenase
LPWTNFDALQRVILDEILNDFGLADLNEAERDGLAQVWYRLKAWPDVKDGLRRLRRKFTVAALSNGNMRMLTGVSKHAGLSWDCILSAELAKHYKPDREVYEMGIALLGLEAHEVMMVAAHKYDLHAARSAGMKTAFVRRPLEFGPEGRPDLTPDPEFDIVAADIKDLATQLGV